MPHARKRLLLVQAFTLAENSPHYLRAGGGGKEAELMNYPGIAPLLADVEWDLHPGPIAPIGDSYVLLALKIPAGREDFFKRRFSPIPGC